MNVASERTAGSAGPAPIRVLRYAPAHCRNRTDPGSPVLVLLPPSREKAPEAARVPWHRGALGSGPLAHPRRDVVEAAKAAVRAAGDDATAVGRLVDASGGAVTPAAQALLEVDERPTGAFLDRYTGILYRVLRGDDWPDAVAERARRQVAVSSALWGVVTGRDAIPDARLNVAASLPDLDRGVATFWRDHLAAALDPVAADRVVVDLRSSGYDRTWVPPDDARGVITARFLRAGTDRAEPSAIGKQRKGALARALLDADLDDDAALSDVLDVAGALDAGIGLDRGASVLDRRRPTLVFRPR